MTQAPRPPHTTIIPTMRDASEPTAPAFAAHTHVIGSAVLVRLCGDFTEHEAPGVQAVFDRAAEVRPDLVIDMRSTRRIDPACMHVMTDHHWRRIEMDARMTHEQSLEELDDAADTAREGDTPPAQE